MSGLDADRQAQVERLLDLYERGAFRGRLSSPPARTARVANPACGDTLTVFLELEPQERVARARYEGSGCTVSVAGAELAMERLEGRSADEHTLAALGAALTDELGPALVRSRAACALLGLRAARAALEAEGREGGGP